MTLDLLDDRLVVRDALAVLYGAGYGRRGCLCQHKRTVTMDMDDTYLKRYQILIPGPSTNSGVGNLTRL